MPKTLLRRYLILPCIALVAMVSCYGQDISYPVKQHSLKPTTDFDQRFYYEPNTVQNIWGYRVGLLINDKYKLGIGGYFMDDKNEDAALTTALTRTSFGTLTNHQQLFLGTIYYEPYLLRKNLWEMSLVFETGYGRNVSYSTDEKNIMVTDRSNTLVIPAGVGLSLNLKLPPIFHVQGFRWFGINAITGYRKIIYQEDPSLQYDGAYWSLSGAIFLDRILDDYHSWKKHRAAVKSNRASTLQF